MYLEVYYKEGVIKLLILHKRDHAINVVLSDQYIHTL